MGTDTVDHADEDQGPEPGEMVVPVDVRGPVRVQQVAVDLPVTRNITLTMSAELVLPADPRRSRTVLISALQDFYFGVSRAEVDAGTAAIWPAGVPLDLRGRRAIFCKVASTTPGTTGVLSYYSETLA